MDTTYTIPAELVHTAIYGICGTLIAVCAYMVIWAVNDGKWKTSTSTRLGALEELIRLHDTYREEHDEYTVRVAALEKANSDDDRYRVEHDKLMMRVDMLERDVHRGKP